MLVWWGRGGVGTWRRFDRRHSWVTSSLGLASLNSSQIKLYRLRDGSRVSIPEVPCHAQAFNQMTLENANPNTGSCERVGRGLRRPYCMPVFLARPELRRARPLGAGFAQNDQHHGQRSGLQEECGEPSLCRVTGRQGVGRRAAVVGCRLGLFSL